MTEAPYTVELSDIVTHEPVASIKRSPSNRHCVDEQDNATVALALTSCTAASTDRSLEPTSSGDVGADDAVASAMNTDSAAGVRQSVCSRRDGGYGNTNADEYVMLRAEFMKQKELKILLVIVYIHIILGNIALFILFVMKVSKGPTFFFQKRTALFAANIAVGSWSILALGATIVKYLQTFYSSRKLGLKWTCQRRHMVTLLFFEVVVMWVNSCCYLIPNALLLADDCSWQSKVLNVCGSIRWICWSTIWTTSLIHAQSMKPLEVEVLKRWREKAFSVIMWLGLIRKGWRQWVQDNGVPPETAVVLDLPLWRHAPKLALWIPPIVLSIVLGSLKKASLVPVPAGSEGPVVVLCNKTVLCADVRSKNVVAIIILAFFCLQSAILVLTLLEVRVQLLRKPYMQFRFASVSLRLMMRNRMSVFTFTATNIALLWFVKYHECNTYIITWFGFLPMQVVVGGFVTTVAWQYMPMKPRKGYDQNQALLQQCVWEEQKKSDFVKESCQPGESLFCFETMLKMWVWSKFVYDAQQVAKTPFTTEVALSLYGLDKFELMWDRAKDTKGVIGWGPGIVVLAFRGTASRENVITDAQAWQDPHPPVRGNKFLSRPRVHKGFLSAWITNDYNKLVVNNVLGIVKQQMREEHGEAPTVYVTGHSLGGALATLAAFEIAQEMVACGAPGKVVCYTFGAPRVGNHAFVAECDALVPDMWHVINDQDIVTRAGKLFGLYKRTPRRVILAPDGCMVVRPNFLEISVYKRNVCCGQGSVPQHLLGSYLETMVMVLVAHHVQSRGIRLGIHNMLKDSPLVPLLELCSQWSFEPLMSTEYVPRTTLLQKKLAEKAKQGGGDDDEGAGKGPTLLLCCG